MRLPIEQLEMRRYCTITDGGLPPIDLGGGDFGGGDLDGGDLGGGDLGGGGDGGAVLVDLSAAVLTLPTSVINTPKAKAKATAVLSNAGPDAFKGLRSR